MKFSLIIPVYNVEEYLEKCLESIINQSYKDFEAIVVNDGTKDSSQDIIDKYVKKDKRIKSYIKENGGLSDARNYGIRYVTGDYIVFIDSDDYINSDLLLKLNEEIQASGSDIIRFEYQIVKNNVINEIKHNCFSNLSKEEAIPLLLKDDVLEMAWSYCYKSEFWKKNNFVFEKGKLHEDYGLIPYTLTMADKISSIDYIGYNYIIREGSIMNSKDDIKDYKKAMDVLEQFNINRNRINVDSYSEKLICSFLANGVINVIKIVPKSKKKEFYGLVRKNKVVDYVVNDTLIRKLKKIYLNLKINIEAI